MQNFTQDDLLLYTFNEAPSDITIAIEKALPNDLSLQMSLFRLRTELNEIQDISFEPSERRLQNVLDILHNDIYLALPS